MCIFDNTLVWIFTYLFLLNFVLKMSAFEGMSLTGKALSNMRNFPVYYILLNFPLLFFSYFSLEVAQWLIFLNLPDIELWHHRCSLCIGICGSVAFSTDVYYWDMRQIKALIIRAGNWTPATRAADENFATEPTLLWCEIENVSVFIVFCVW